MAPQLTQAQRFVVERWPRASIKGAPYNPRQIDRYARKKLEENLRKVGLIAAVVVNRRTGNLVAGHQRLAAMDAIEGGTGYSLDVAVVDLTAAEEKQQNVFMNNASAQGTWDLDKLGGLLAEPGLDVSATGFTSMDLQILFEDRPSSFFAAEETRAEKPPLTPEEVSKLKESRKVSRQRLNQQAVGMYDFYTVVIFPDADSRAAFLRELGVEGQYVDGMLMDMGTQSGILEARP